MKKFWIKFILFSILTLVLSYAIEKVLQIDVLIQNELSYKFSINELKEILNFQRKWNWILYIFIPIFIFIKILSNSLVVYTGILFLNNIKTDFKEVLNILLKVEFVFLLIPISKLIWFYFFQTNYTLEDIQYFYPLSALNIIGYKGLESWLIYPLQTLNVFELAYIIILSYQIGTVTKTNADTGLKIVASSYIPALLLWVTIVMFFTLNFS
jgi:hypothetical protein